MGQNDRTLAPTLQRCTKVQEEGIVSVSDRRNAILEAPVFVVGRIESAGPCLVGEGRIGDSEIKGPKAAVLVIEVRCSQCAAFAKPEVYEYLESRDTGYAMRLPANGVLQRNIRHLLKRPVGRPPKKPVVRYHDFVYQAQSWDIPRRVVAEVEWRQGELFPRVGFVVTNLNLPPAGVTHYYNGRGHGRAVDQGR